ncbi:hypothetical protein FS837_009852 [Tulasnella sp. UAMH 9824]|nr:hypothetical protein FS837_009852 [Tulasnella sp. UAMH 9824]
MKAFLTLFSPLLLAIAPLGGASPIEKRVVCPFLVPAPSPDPFEASALPGYYLDSAGKVAVLVKGQPLKPYTYSSNGPLGVWGPARTNTTCPSYFYLNSNYKTANYQTLTFDAAATTKWDAAPGSDLTRLIIPPSSTFYACKRPATSTKYGDYVLFLKTGDLQSILESDDGDSIAATYCETTNIHLSQLRFLIQFGGRPAQLDLAGPDPSEELAAPIHFLTTIPSKAITEANPNETIPVELLFDSNTREIARKWSRTTSCRTRGPSVRFSED